MSVFLEVFGGDGQLRPEVFGSHLICLESLTLIILDRKTKGGTPVCLASFPPTSMGLRSCLPHFHFVGRTNLASLFLKEGVDGSGLVHTHKIVRGQLDIASGIANYGLHLARKVAIPEAVVNKANTIIEVIRANEVALPEVSEDDIMRLNCLRLAMTLQKLSTREDMDLSDKVEMAKELQRHFASMDDDDDIDDVDEVDEVEMAQEEVNEEEEMDELLASYSSQ